MSSYRVNAIDIISKLEAVHKCYWATKKNTEWLKTPSAGAHIEWRGRFRTEMVFTWGWKYQQVTPWPVVCWYKFSQIYNQISNSAPWQRATLKLNKTINATLESLWILFVWLRSTLSPISFFLGSSRETKREMGRKKKNFPKLALKSDNFPKLDDHLVDFQLHKMSSIC